MVLGDKAYDANWLRDYIAERGGWTNIPPKTLRKSPICFSPCLYKQRNLVERFFNKLKYFRRIATRYDKLGSAFHAMVKLAFIRIRLRIMCPRPSLVRLRLSHLGIFKPRAYFSRLKFL